MTAYFSMKVVPTPLGYDPRMQFVHEDDVLGAIQAAVHLRAHGPVNIAGDGVLLLSQALLRAGRPILPVFAPLLPSVGRALAPRSLVDFSTEGMRYLQYGRALDTTAMRESLGFVPSYTTAEAFNDFLQRGRASEEVSNVG